MVLFNPVVLLFPARVTTSFRKLSFSVEGALLDPVFFLSLSNQSGETEGGGNHANAEETSRGVARIFGGGGGRDLPIGPNSVCFVESSIFTAFV